VKDVVKFFAKLPKDFVAKAALPGTTAFEYLNGKRSVYGLIDDPDLLFVIDDKHTDGGILLCLQRSLQRGLHNAQSRLKGAPRHTGLRHFIGQSYGEIIVHRQRNYFSCLLER
jgi:hypothetical protein